MSGLHRPLLRIWTDCHGVNLRWIIIVISAWVAAAALTHVGLPRIDPQAIIQPVNLQQVGVVGLAGVAGAMSISLHQESAWLSAIGVRSMTRLRSLWFLTLTGSVLILGFVTSLVIPAGVPRFSGYLAIAVIWWAIATLATVIGGQIPGLLAPVIVAVLATVKVVPWHANLIFRPELANVRFAAAIVGIIVTAAIYAHSGSAHTRRQT